MNAIQSFLGNLSYKPNAVDLGCGDFNVGMKIRGMCNQYVACDVVDALIERNKAVHKGANVDFRCLDMCEDALPSGDIVFVRQVFQHLTNRQILSVVNKLSMYKFLILTEGLPARKDFVANGDKPIGDGIRFQRKVSSGVVLTLPPFNLVHKYETVLCEVPCGEAVIRTTAYQLQ
ncbi:MAG: class I SAM-dependent methyltransferase [Chloroflexi bacterium]|nr:class I SAM-dependent methyltransferase [Chloroflexota bacterium]